MFTFFSFSADHCLYVNLAQVALPDATILFHPALGPVLRLHWLVQHPVFRLVLGPGIKLGPWLLGFRCYITWLIGARVFSITIFAHGPSTAVKHLTVATRLTPTRLSNIDQANTSVHGKNISSEAGLYCYLTLSGCGFIIQSLNCFAGSRLTWKV